MGDIVIYFGTVYRVDFNFLMVLFRNSGEAKTAEPIEIDLVKLQEMITEQQRVIDELIEANERLEERLEALEE